MGRRGWRLNREASGLMGVSTPQQYDTHLRAALAKYARMVKFAGIKVE